MEKTRINYNYAIAIKTYLIVFGTFLASGLGIVHAQDDWGGDGSYANPYFAEFNATESMPARRNQMGQTLTQVYGHFFLERKELNIIWYTSPAGFKAAKSQTGGYTKFEYSGYWDDDCKYTGELLATDREYRNFFVLATGMEDRDISRTLEWESSWDQVQDSGTQSAEAVVKIQNWGTIDNLDYQFTFDQSHWTLDANRDIPDFFQGVGQGSGSCFFISDGVPNNPVPDPGILYGTLIDWIWDPVMRNARLHTMGSTGGLNITVPVGWSNSQMSWMIPQV